MQVLHGVLWILVGSCAKFLMDWRTSRLAPVRARAEAMFCLAHVGPDLIILSLALIASMQALAGLRGAPEDSWTTNLYCTFIPVYVLALLLTVIFWRQFVVKKSFPIVPDEPDDIEFATGSAFSPRDKIDYRGVLGKREGRWLLINDLIGSTCVVFYAVYAMVNC